MSTYKKKQKELRSPDAFQKAGQEAIPWLVHNQTRLLVLVILLAVGGGAMALWKYTQQRAELREAEAFSNALAPFMPPSGNTAAKTPAETDRELLNSLQAFEAQSKDGTPSARNAHLLLAYVHLRLGQPEEAQKAAERFLAQAPKENPLRQVALEAKAYALEQSKQYELAFAAFGELEAEVPSDFKGKGEYHQARMLLLKGEREAALALFEKVAALDLPKNEAVSLAKQRAEGLLRAPPANAPSANNEATN